MALTVPKRSHFDLLAKALSPCSSTPAIAQREKQSSTKRHAPPHALVDAASVKACIGYTPIYSSYSHPVVFLYWRTFPTCRKAAQPKSNKQRLSYDTSESRCNSTGDS